ncbi:hypothetical protein MAP00_005467 [Monascus purpureus]|nr:hypothetical protein MAP00_005467 [Monascus purpureus]
MVAITLHVIENYPDQSTLVSAIINGWRTAGGFSVGYFQPPWIAKDGTAVVFGVQAAVLVGMLILTVSPMIFLGRRKAKLQPGWNE